MNRILFTFMLLISCLAPSIILGNDGKCVEGDCVNGLGIFMNHGVRYIGKWKAGKHNGDGIMNFPNGDKYIGEWKDGRRHGEGSLNFSDGGKYAGEWKDDLPDGQGTEINPDGDTYIGEWKDGKRHGEGTLNFSDGGKYVGEWKNDLPDGQGIEIDPDGDIYIGEWKNGKKNGQGILNFPDGGKYIGEWKDDLQDGQGTEINPDGTKYEGQFKNSIKIGRGREISSDVIKEGEWQDGKFVYFSEPDKSEEIEKYDSAEKCIEKAHCKIKKGFIYYTNGSSYEGEFLQMLPHGSGYYTLPDGTSVFSQKSNNLPHGKGKFISFNGEIIEGNFMFGKHVSDNVTESQLMQVEKIKSEVTTSAEKRDETEPKETLPQNFETTKALKYGRISVRANIRSNASLTSEVLHTVPPGYPVAVLERQADWLLVEDYRGRKGWVFASLVKEPKTVIIKVYKGNLRSGPSLEDDIIVQLDHGKIMPVLERTEEWLKVSDFEGLTGWLHRKVIWPERDNTQSVNKF